MFQSSQSSAKVSNEQGYMPLKAQGATRIFLWGGGGGVADPEVICIIYVLF
jgi:hypothetical protein